MKFNSNKASLFFIFVSCNIYVIHSQHLPLQKKEKNIVRKCVFCFCFFKKVIILSLITGE